MAKMNREKAKRDQLLRERPVPKEKIRHRKAKTRNGRTILKSKWQTYCCDCHFTIWANERIGYDGKAHHISCGAALKDSTPRVLDTKYLDLFGNVSKERLALML